LVESLLQSGTNRTQCDTLILGADITHPSGSDSHGTPSIAALVGSVDGNFSKLSGSMRLNPGRQEIIDRMQSMAEERIEKWYRLNENRMPARTLFYRDGVGEAQFSQVLAKEVEAIRKAHKAVAAKIKGMPPKVKITAIVLTKRHHTRFFPTEPKYTTNTGNCKVGTLVDAGITSPYICDFFLLSHNVLAGTGRPAHYYVLLNEMLLNITKLQKTTFELCFTYGRSRTSVSYVPPAYYADRLCERGRLYLKPLKEWIDGAKKKKKEQEADLSEAEVFDIAKKLFYREDRGHGLQAGQEGNPWHKFHDGKMFWMRGVRPLMAFGQSS
jgi:eukaryotic translation initiation factor 2C